MFELVVSVDGISIRDKKHVWLLINGRWYYDGSEVDIRTANNLNKVAQDFHSALSFSFYVER